MKQKGQIQIDEISSTLQEMIPRGLFCNPAILCSSSYSCRPRSRPALARQATATTYPSKAVSRGAKLLLLIFFRHISLILSACAAATTSFSASLTAASPAGASGEASTSARPALALAAAAKSILRDPFARCHVAQFLSEKEFCRGGVLQLLYGSKQEIYRVLQKRGVGSAFVAQRIAAKLKSMREKERGRYSLLNQDHQNDDQDQHQPEAGREQEDVHHVAGRQRFRDVTSAPGGNQNLPAVAVATTTTISDLQLRAWTVDKVELIRELGNLCEPAAVEELRRAVPGTTALFGRTIQEHWPIAMDHELHARYDPTTPTEQRYTVLQHNEAVAKAAAQSLAGVGVACHRLLELEVEADVGQEPRKTTTSTSTPRNVFAQVLEVLHKLRTGPEVSRGGGRAVGLLQQRVQNDLRHRELAIHALALLCEHTAVAGAFERLANVRDFAHLRPGDGDIGIPHQQTRTSSTPGTTTSPYGGNGLPDTESEMKKAIGYLSKFLDVTTKRPVVMLNSFWHAPESLITRELQAQTANDEAEQESGQNNMSPLFRGKTARRLRRYAQSRYAGRVLLLMWERDRLALAVTRSLRRGETETTEEEAVLPIVNRVSFYRPTTLSLERSVAHVVSVFAKTVQDGDGRGSGGSARGGGAGARTPPAKQDCRGHEDRDHGSCSCFGAANIRPKSASRNNWFDGNKLKLWSSSEKMIEADGEQYDEELLEMFGGGSGCWRAQQTEDGRGNWMLPHDRPPSVALGEHPAAGSILHTLQRAALQPRGMKIVTTKGHHDHGQAQADDIARDALAVIAAKRTLATPRWKMFFPSSATAAGEQLCAGVSPGGNLPGEPRAAFLSPHVLSHVALREGIRSATACLAGLSLKASASSASTSSSSASRERTESGRGLACHPAQARPLALQDASGTQTASATQSDRESLLAAHFRKELANVGLAVPGVNCADNALLTRSSNIADGKGKGNKFDLERFYGLALEKEVLRRKTEWVSWNAAGVVDFFRIRCRRSSLSPCCELQ